MISMLTPWYTPTTRPTRIGWYETRISGWHHVTMRYWTGTRWDGKLTPQCLYWRGYSADPALLPGAAGDEDGRR